MKKIILYIVAAGLAASMMPMYSMDMDERADGQVYQQSAQEREQQEQESREQQMREAREAARADVNLYEIMNVSSFATQQDINNAYRSLARQLHPDRNGGNADAFARMSKANEILSDQEVRAMYDRYYFLDGIADNIANAFRFSRPTEPTRHTQAKKRREARKKAFKKNSEQLAQAQKQRAQSRLEQIRNSRFVAATKRRMRAMAQIARRRAYSLSAAAIAASAAAAPLMITHCSDVAQAYCAGEQVAPVALQACTAVLPSTAACWTGYF